MRAAITKTIERIEQEFQRRAFGEERARVNALPVAERRAYLHRMQRRAAASRGGKLHSAD